MNGELPVAESTEEEGAEVPGFADYRGSEEREDREGQVESCERVGAEICIVQVFEDSGESGGEREEAAEDQEEGERDHNQPAAPR